MGADSKTTEKQDLQLETKRQHNNDGNQSRGRVSDHPDFGDLDTGWAWVVVFASFCSLSMSGGMIYTVGIIHSTLLDLFDEDEALTSWAGAINTSILSIAGPVSSLVIDRFSCRVAIMGSGILYVLGNVITAFAPNLIVAMVTYGIIAGTGGALGYTAAIIVVGFNFRRHKNMALGICLSGVGAGLFLLAPLMQMARDHYGNNGFFIILAAMCANIITCGCMCFPSQLEQHTQKMRKLEMQRMNALRSQRCTFLKSYNKVVTNKGVLLISFSMVFYLLGTYIVFQYLPEYTVSKHFSALQASYCVSAMGIASVIGRLLTGFVANLERVPDIVLYSGSLGVVTVMTYLFPLYSGYYAGQLTYSVVFGLFVGSCYVLLSSVCIQHIGIEYLSATIGFTFFCGTLGSLMRPIVIDVVVKVGGTYDHFFIVAATCCLLATLMSGATVFISRDKTDVVGLPEIDVMLDQSNTDTQLCTDTEPCTDTQRNTVPSVILDQERTIGHTSC